MNLRSQKRLAAKILKAGAGRIKVKNVKEVEEAITRDDIRKLIDKGLIEKEQKKGYGRVHARKRLEQEKKGRRRGKGSRKGKKRAKINKKEAWMTRVRALRKLLRELKENGRISRSDYRKVYMKVKGGAFRSKHHMISYLKDNEILKERENNG